ncbi:MAG: hypothetical protein J5720_07100 [Bacteroidaceae bacterium]|nr:hypothetical protein [Bacteroidaceae bacterium]
MKNLFLVLAFMIGTLTAHAADYTYLTFETTDGAKVSVEVSSLTIAISGTTLTAGGQSFTLSNLSKMYFSTSDETSDIKAISTEELNEVTEVYDLSGRKVSKDQMTKGVYVIKSKSGTCKIAVK